MPVVSLENRQGSGIVSNQLSSASSSASQTQSSSLFQKQGEPIGSSVNGQTARALFPFEPPLFPPSTTTSFPAIFRIPDRQQTTSLLTTPTSTPIAMPAIPNYRENRVVPVTHPPTQPTHHSRSSSLPTITTSASLIASRPLAIQASVTAPEERTPTPQSRQEQSPGDPMVIDSPDNAATSLLVRAATDQQVFKQGEKRALPPKTTVSPQSQHRDKRRTNEELATRSRSGSQVNQQPATAAAAESPKVAPETSTTAASIDKLRTEIAVLAEAMKNIPIIAQNQEHLVRRQEAFAKGQDAKMNIVAGELEKQSRRINDISGTVETRTEAISSQMKVQSDAISRLDMRFQGVEANSRRSSIPISIPATPDENVNDFSSAIVPKRSHPDSRALESALQGSREERLHKAGLQKEQTSIPVSSIPIVMPDPIRPIPMVVPEFADIITKPHLPDITYARGATHIKKSIEERQHIHQVVVVNALTRFGTQTGIFLDLDTQRFYAEIRSEDHPQYCRFRRCSRSLSRRGFVATLLSAGALGFTRMCLSSTWVGKRLYYNPQPLIMSPLSKIAILRY